MGQFKMWREQIVHFSAMGNQVFFNPHFGIAALSCPACIFVVRFYSMIRYLVIFEKTDTGYSAFVPDLPGCVATGPDKPGTEKVFMRQFNYTLKD
jgi:hypothetical protein